VSSSFKVEVPDLDQVVRGLDNVGEALRHLDDLDDAAADVVVRAAGPRTPRRTGRLESRTRAQDGAVVNDLIYAGVIHNGWAARHIKAQPWIVEAGESSTDEWTAVYVDGVNELLGKVGKQ
jgi:hypothetical protein